MTTGVKECSKAWFLVREFAADILLKEMGSYAYSVTKWGGGGSREGYLGRGTYDRKPLLHTKIGVSISSFV